MSGGHLRIGQVAARAELSINTVRHYDEVGLVSPSARSTGGFRLYTESDVDRLLVIRRMKPLGFTLAEMRDLLDALETLDGEEASEDQRAAATQYLHRCHTSARRSVDRLRRHLAYAEELTGLIAARTVGVPDGS